MEASSIGSLLTVTTLRVYETEEPGAHQMALSAAARVACGLRAEAVYGRVGAAVVGARFSAPHDTGMVAAVVFLVALA